MQSLKAFSTQLREFDVNSDYFCLVDTIHTLFDRGPPLSRKRIVRIPWAIINVCTVLQVLCLVVQFISTLIQDLIDIDEFMMVCNQTFILIISVFRGGCLAYHRHSIQQLKKFINSRVCLWDNVEAFEMRKATFRRNIKYMAIFQLTCTLNCIVWISTDFWKAEVLQIPFLYDHLPERLGFWIKLMYALMYHSWSVMVYTSVAQFGTILNSLRTELKIIALQFETLFESVVTNYVVRKEDLSNLDQTDADAFWKELAITFKSSISHHVSFIRHYELLKKISSLSLFVLLISAAIIITTNTLLFITDLTIARIPLQLVAIQFMFETYLCCTMMDTLQTENKRIAEYVYVIDWLSVCRRTSEGQRKSAKCIRQNALLLQLQIHEGLKIRAGNMFAVNRETFANLMRVVYSLLTFILRQTG